MYIVKNLKTILLLKRSSEGGFHFGGYLGFVHPLQCHACFGCSTVYLLFHQFHFHLAPHTTVNN